MKLTYMRQNLPDTYGILELQDKILEIALYLDEFCKKHDIVYYLMSGSALGAMRHQGFIPWDDDLDVFMDYKNYQKFISCAEKYLDTDKYYFQKEDTKELPYFFSKLRMNNTTCIEYVNKNRKMHQGIFVDIMCLNNAAPKGIRRIIQYYSAALLKASAVAKTAYKTDNKLKKIQLFVAKIFVKGFIKKILLNFVRRYNNIPSKEGAHIFGRAKFKNSFYPIEDFGVPRYVNFEKVKLPVPNKAEEYLTIRFGKNYMQIPDEKTKKIYQSHAMKWDTKKSYKEYENEKKNECIRILQIVSSLNQGSGVLQVVLNWHRNIDRTKIQFDYLYFTESSVNCKNEIENLGGKCYQLPYPSFTKPWIFIKEVKRFFKTYKYNTIHSHVIHLAFFFYPIAKFYGVKNIVHHSHTAKWSDKILNGLRNRFLFFWIRPFVTKKIACSDLAGKFLFKKNYTIINNGIDTEKFKFNQDVRNKIRKELNIENKFVLGHVGRFSHEKNHNFIIDLFNEIHKQDNNSVLLLIGDGSLKNEIERKVKNLNLSDNVIFTGTKSNVGEFYQAMDIFVLPSFQEGLGLVAIEAQCSGLPCFISDSVPDETVICNTTKILLSKSAKQWADIILEKTKNFERKDCSDFIKQANYDIKETTNKIQDIYLKLNGNNNG